MTIRESVKGTDKLEDYKGRGGEHKIGFWKKEHGIKTFLILKAGEGVLDKMSNYATDWFCL